MGILQSFYHRARAHVTQDLPRRARADANVLLIWYTPDIPHSKGDTPMRRLLLIVGALFLVSGSLEAQSSPPFLGLGDSIGEGVQSLDAAAQTQVNGYLNLIGTQMGFAFPLPLIETGPLGVVGSVFDRNRIYPLVLASNLASSGTDSTSILTELAGTPIVNEADLVLSPRTGVSQISIAESLRSPLIICWVGNNDVLGAVTEFDQLNPTEIASQITPTATFDANYAQITSRLGALGSKVVYANIPDVTEAAFLFSPQDLVTFLGSDYGLPQGSYTTLIAMLLIKLGLDDGSILQNPNWVLDPSEIQTIEQAISTFNHIIAVRAAKAYAPVVDLNGLSRRFVQTPPVVGSFTLTRSYLGGLFSLDGVHPSDIGYALVANQFIQTIDNYYHLHIPAISATGLVNILDADPFVDFNHSLVVRGRPGVGLLETLGLYLGISGDQGNTPLVSPGVKPALGQRFMEQYLISQGKDPNTKWTRDDAIAAFRQIFHYTNQQKHQPVVIVPGHTEVLPHD